MLSKRSLIPALGRVRTFMLGGLLQFTALLMLALLPFIQSDAAFLVTGVLARFIQGGGAAIQILIGFAILSLVYM